MIDESLTKYREARAILKREVTAFRQEEQRQRDCEDAKEIIVAIAEQTQQQAQQTLANVVTRCLKYVWGDLYKFKIDVERKRGKTEARLVLVRNDGLELDPLAEASGGVIDVAAFALRMVCIYFSPHARKLLLLDEPFKNVRGEEYQRRVAEMLESMVEQLDFQVVLNTDAEWIRVGRVVEM